MNISFPNQHKATLVLPTATDTPENIVNALGINSYKSVIIILGGADSIDQNLLPKITPLFDRGIARAAVNAEALIIDGGTQAGVMKLMGEAVANRDYKLQLVGVAPESMVSYPTKDDPDGLLTPLEPNHSHFVLVKGTNWGDVTAMLFDLVKECTNRKKNRVIPDKKRGKKELKEITEKVPCVALLAGGGPTSKNEVLFAVRRNIPLIIIAGSGGLADEIAKALADKTTFPENPVMAEIVADGDIQIHPLSNSVKGIERLIVRELGIDKVLMQAWQTFADYDKNAKNQQRKFNLVQKWIIWIGIIGTALVIIQQALPPKDAAGKLIPVSFPLPAGTEWFRQLHVFSFWLMHYFLILVPISLTVLLTISSRFKPGNKWLLLRGGAEAIKREIYKYRVRCNSYTKEPEKQLSQKVEEITRRTMRTEVNMSAVVRYVGEIPPDMGEAPGRDDGFSYLSPDKYVDLRVSNQVEYFGGKTRKLEVQLKKYSFLAYIAGGVGTYLVAMDLQLWLPLTTAIVAGVASYFGYRQTENTLIKYNQAAADLSNVRAWWNALSAEEQAQSANIDSLVEHTELILQSEMDGWVQQMQNALDNLRKPDDSKKADDKEPDDPKNPKDPKN